MQKLTKILLTTAALPLGLAAWTPAPAPTVPLMEAVQDPVEVRLEAVEGSAAAGTARFADAAEGAVEVASEVQGTPADTELVAVLAEGTCQSPGAVPSETLLCGVATAAPAPEDEG